MLTKIFEPKGFEVMKPQPMNWKTEDWRLYLKDQTEIEFQSLEKAVDGNMNLPLRARTDSQGLIIKLLNSPLSMVLIVFFAFDKIQTFLAVNSSSDHPGKAVFWDATTKR